MNRNQQGKHHNYDNGDEYIGPWKKVMVRWVEPLKLKALTALFQEKMAYESCSGCWSMGRE